MYNIGMYGGSFNPLHIGHIEVITKAYTLCKELYILVSVSNNPEEIDINLRYSWLHQATQHMSHVKILVLHDDSILKEEYDWEKETTRVKGIINKPIDIVFYGDDYASEHNPFKDYFHDSVQYVFKRNTYSSSLIRNDPFKYWDYIPLFVRPYYVKKVLIVGTESCAKSTLTKQLALYFNTNCVQETGREICDHAGNIEYMTNDDYYSILINHKVIENQQLQYANKLLFIDTSQIVTAYYATITNRSEAKDIYKLARVMFETMKYDTVFYLKPDVEWVQDGTRTFGEEEIRSKNDKILENMYKEIGISLINIDGNYENRFDSMISKIKEMYKL